MGVADFLTRVLDTAGRPCDLSAYSEGVGRKRRKRPLRVGIDVSTWIHNAAHGFGDILGDERHLTNYGRANLYQEQQGDPASSLNPSEETIQEYVATCTKNIMARMDVLQDTTHADILVVLDGDSPPIKKREAERRREIRRESERVREQPVDPMESPSKTNARRTKAFRRAGAGRYYSRIVEEILKALREAEIPFMVAPYEADSQLAYLSDMGYLDLVITEDSDLVAHGAKTILYKSASEKGNNRFCGKLLQFSDIGAVVGESFNLSDFTPVMMAVLFISVGCDYCDKLKGVGMLTACRIIREAFLEAPRQANKKGKSKLTRVLQGLYSSSYLDSSKLTPQFKFDYEERFLAALLMYRHPIIYDPLQEDNFLTSRSLVEPGTDDGEEMGPIFLDRELMDHDAYVELCGDLDRIQDIVGQLRPREEAMRRAQGLNEQLAVERDAEEEERLPAVTAEDSHVLPESEAESLALDPQGESQFLATQEDFPFGSDNLNGACVDSVLGDDVMETSEASLLSDNEDPVLGTQPLTSPMDKPLSRHLVGEFEVANSEAHEAPDSVAENPLRL